ncbi:tumor protein D54 isoform X1 [Lingula anatina]|uniref:Tumor protein D54 isoform X1 n=1 Tax=Lingula anatina TaxID=7574 RepID=A0A1S3KDP0_LINAN|nr:tumor protein D54 isoform X1 [Lingula anatina]|eukprot:XP_013420612.2 tumor protein D54 isoform X1 [Lingula anatina]
MQKIFNRNNSKESAKPKGVRTRKIPAKEAEEEEYNLEYQPTITSPNNYHSFLKLVHTSGSFSDDEINTDKTVEGSEDVEDAMNKMADQKKQDDHFYDTAELATPDSGIADTSPTKDPAEVEKEKEEWRVELAKTEEEIQTLRSVLGAKVRHANELKKKLGITTLQEFKQDVSSTLTSIRESDAYKKTSEKVHQLEDKITHSETYKKTNEKLHQWEDKITSSGAYQKTNEAFKNVGTKASQAANAAGKKLSDLRNSQTFKSIEEKVGSAYSNVKAKVTGSKSETNFDEALTDTATEQQESNGTGPAPETKVPL